MSENLSENDRYAYILRIGETMNEYWLSEVSNNYLECGRCGAVVADRDIHDEWHLDLAGDWYSNG